MNNRLRTIFIIIMYVLLTGCKSEIVENELENIPPDIQTNVIEKNMEESIEPTYKIIKQIKNMDIDNDDLIDDIFLYYDNQEVLLMAKDISFPVISVGDEEQIFGEVLSDQYLCNLYVNGNKILVGITYSFTNKYGSTSWLYCYEYEEGKLKKIWDSDVLQERRIVIDNYDNENNIINLFIDQEHKEMIIDERDEKSFLEFTNYIMKSKQEVAEMEFRIMPEYAVYDYNNDKVNELITRVIVTYGACPITDSYIAIYEFTDKGITEVDSFFASSNSDVEHDLFNH